MGEPLGYQKLIPVVVVEEEEDEGVAFEVDAVDVTIVDLVEVCNNNNNLYLYSLLLKNKLQ